MITPGGGRFAFPPKKRACWEPGSLGFAPAYDCAIRRFQPRVLEGRQTQFSSVGPGYLEAVRILREFPFMSG